MTEDQPSVGPQVSNTTARQIQRELTPTPEGRPAPRQAPYSCPDVPEERILTPAEVARLFRVETKTVTEWAKAGKLNSFRTLGGVRRYYASEVEKQLRDNGWTGLLPRRGRPEGA